PPPLLSLDRPFTYSLAGDQQAGTGSLVSVRFHGKLTKGWVLGPSVAAPEKMLDVQKVHGGVRFFDQDSLRLLRWVAERTVAPLATVIGRSVPPRVVSEEEPTSADPTPEGARMAPPAAPVSAAVADVSSTARSVLEDYRGGRRLLETIASGEGASIVRPSPAQEVSVAVEAVGACLAGGRRAIVLVPEAAPVPATARALAETFAGRCLQYLGGSKRDRYRMWLDVLAGRYEVVVGTRPAVFAPLQDVGLIWVARESHAAHREDRSPYYHVRDVALARAALSGAVAVMASLCPSSEAVATGAPEVTPQRRSWPPVEVVKPGSEGRAPRLVSALKQTRGAFLFEPLRGYGVAQICRSCGEAAGCSVCGGILRMEGGRVGCAVCGAAGTCAKCGATDFGVRRGGAERVEEWVRGIVSLPVRAGEPASGSVAVGGADAVRDLGPVGLDLVGILEADLVVRRPGIGATERGLAVWMEAAAWAAEGRVIVQTNHANDPSVQALVGGNPSRFYRAEFSRRTEAGFPPGAPVFRVTGGPELPDELQALAPIGLLVSSPESETICLVTIGRDDVRAFGERIRELAREGIVTRVEAEPHL
ncbi:MAG: hypothetical protein WD004_07515, partial [Actinomycetota bacterium]